MPAYVVSSRTHVGHRYQHNEDRIGQDPARGVWVVADGMGGHARGDLAAETVVATLLEAENLTAAPLDGLLLRAHQAVRQQGRALGHEAMGSTAVMLRLPGEGGDSSAELGWCGDSRAYLWRSGDLVQLSRDHSLLEELMKSGLVQPEEAFGHPQKHVLVQALGIDDPVPRPGVVRIPVRPGDVVLLCSDGLHDELPEAALRAVFAAAVPGPLTERVAAQDALDELTVELERAVLQGDARDNISMVAVGIVAITAGPIESAAALRADIAAQWQVLESGRFASGEITAATTETATPSAGSPLMWLRKRLNPTRWFERVRRDPLRWLIVGVLAVTLLALLAV